MAKRRPQKKTTKRTAKKTAAMPKKVFKGPPKPVWLSRLFYLNVPVAGLFTAISAVYMALYLMSKTDTPESVLTDPKALPAFLLFGIWLWSALRIRKGDGLSNGILWAMTALSFISLPFFLFYWFTHLDAPWTETDKRFFFLYSTLFLSLFSIINIVLLMKLSKAPSRALPKPGAGKKPTRPAPKKEDEIEEIEELAITDEAEEAQEL